MVPGVSDNDDSAERLQRAGAGDVQALAELWQHHRARLRRMVQPRLDRRLQGRLDASDVLQEAYLEVSRSIESYQPSMPLFLWLRLITGRKLQVLHRYHLGTHQRDAGREMSLYRGPLPQASSVTLAAHLLGRLTTPSEAAVRAERQLRVQEALNAMNPLDREVLALRHFEQLTNAETAQTLKLSETAASNRYVRALKRLKSILTSAGESNSSSSGQGIAKSSGA